MQSLEMTLPASERVVGKLSEVLLRYLADNTNYSDFIRGIDRLTSEQKEVLFARLQAEIGKHVGGCVEDKKSEKIVVVNGTKKIELAVEIANKPKSVIECCLHCGSVANITIQMTYWMHLKTLLFSLKMEKNR